MPKLVIAVDDSMSVRETVKMTLQTAGYNVLTADDGAQGLSLCEKHKADLVITDLNMPNLNGLELIRRLRAGSMHKFTPMLLLTTESDPAKKQEGRAAGATGWIIKPFNPEQLLAVVKKVIG
jgi:two-component system chemotaxis response regulator CheY